MVYFQFRDYVAIFKPEKIEYLHKGELKTFFLSDASSHNELLKKNPYLWRKFLDFRTIKKFDPQPCTH
jgi:hypothetical protein